MYRFVHFLIFYLFYTSTWTNECIGDSTVHLVVDSTVHFDFAPAKSAHYVSVVHGPIQLLKCVPALVSWQTIYIDMLGDELEGKVKYIGEIYLSVVVILN